jgi:hypothetical protein
MKIDDVYGMRSDRHQHIMEMSEDELHAEYPWAQALVYNESMLKADFVEKSVRALVPPLDRCTHTLAALVRRSQVPDASVIHGTTVKGGPHRFCVGNEQGEILPKFLMAKLIVIESNKVWRAPSAHAVSWIWLRLYARAAGTRFP